MATDLNAQLNLDTLLSNLDTLIKKTEELNSTLMDVGKTAEDTAKSTAKLNNAQKQSEDIISDTAKATNNLTVEEIELAKVQDNVVKTAEKLTVVNSEENKQLQKNKIAYAEANKEIRDKIKADNASTKATEDATKALNIQAKSIGEAQAQNKALRRAIKDVDVTTAGAADTIAEINKKIDENDKLITENSDSFIQQKRNIGNYKSALDELGGAFVGVSVEVKNFISNPKGGTEAVKNSIQTLNTSLKTLLANPVVAIVAGITAAFGALRQALNSTEEGQQALATATGFLSGVFSALNEIVVALIDPLVRLFNDPQQAIEDFQQAIKDKIFRVFENLKNIALGVGEILTGLWERDLDKITEGAEKAGKAFIELNQEVNPTVILLTKAAEQANNIFETAKATAEIEKERFQLESRRNAFIVREAEIKRDIANLLLDSKNEELSAQERLDKVIQSEQLAKQLSEERIADKKEQLRLLEAEAALGSDNLEDNRAFAQLQAEIIGLEKAQADELRSLGNRRRTILSELDKQKESEQELFEQQQERFKIQQEQDINTRELKITQDAEDLERLKESEEAKRKLAEETAKAQQAFAKQTTDIGLDFAADAFGAEKEAAIAKAAINTSEGITKALATGGFAGIAQGVLIGAAGAVQIAKIAGVNAFYKGTKNAPKGLAMVSERGAEIIENKAGELRLIPDMSLVNLKGGEKIHTAGETRKMLFDDSRIVRELRAQRKNIIVNINPESYSSKYRLKA